MRGILKELEINMSANTNLLLSKATVYDASRRHSYEPFEDDVCETVQAAYGTGG